MRVVGEDISYELDGSMRSSVKHGHDAVLSDMYRNLASAEIMSADRSLLKDIVRKDREIIGFSRWNISKLARNFRKATKNLLTKLNAETLPPLEDNEVNYLVEVLEGKKIKDIDDDIELPAVAAPLITASLVLDSVERRNNQLYLKSLIPTQLQGDVDKKTDEELDEMFRSEGTYSYEDPLFILWCERRGRLSFNERISSAYDLSKAFDFSLSEACVSAMAKKIDSKGASQ